MVRTKHLALALVVATAVGAGGAAHSAPGPDGDGPAGPPATAATTPEPRRLALEELIEQALLGSRELAAERHRLAAVEAQIEQLFWAPFSGFSLGGAFSMVPDKCVDTTALSDQGILRNCDGGSVSSEEDWYTKEWGPTFHVEVKGGVPLYTFGKISNAKQAAKEARAAKEAGLPAIEHRIRADVTRAYHAVIGSREMLYTVGEGRKHLEKARQRLEQELAAEEGTETQVDLIKLQVFEAEIDHLEQQTRQIEQTALAALRFLVGGPDASRIEVPDEPQTLLERKLEPLVEYLDRALQHRPELAAIRHAVKALEAKVEMRRSDFWPDLLLVLSWRYGWTPGRTDISNWMLTDNYNYGGGVPAAALALRYNLDWGLDIYRLDEAKAELSAAVADQQRALDGILLDVRTTYIKVAGTRESIDKLGRSRTLVKGWIAAVAQGHAAGLNSSKDVKDALKEYFTIMAQMHALIGEYNAGLAALDRAAGGFQPSVGPDRPGE
ncbi:MAG TPA: TolC family protein [Polyangia bacterium]|nr:TolC family protein [Polyangia bacterium]